MRAARQSRRSWVAVTTILLATLVLVLAPAATSSALVPCGLDPAFGAGGVLVSDLGGNDYANGLAVRPGGSIGVAGSSYDEMMAAQYGPDGTLDPSFGTAGVVRISHDPTLGSTASDVALQQDGKVVLAGREFGAVSGSSLFDIAVARLNPDGTRDTSFGGGDGVVYLDLQGQQDEAAAVAVDSAGRVVVLNLRTDFDAAYGLALKADGALLVAGSYQPSVLTPWLARLHADGTRDRRVGRKGLLIQKVSGAGYDVTVQADGRTVTAGQLLADLADARYLPDVKADGSFGAGGVATVKVDPSGFLHGQAMGVAIHADGTILAVGAATATSVSDMAAVALLADGTPDARFGSGGVVLHHDPVGWNSALQDVALLPDGSALAAGYVGYDSALARYTPCG